MYSDKKCPILIKDLYSDTISKMSKSFTTQFEITYVNADDMQREIESGQPTIYRDFFALVAGTERWTEEKLNTIPGLRLIARSGSGIDNLPLEYCKANNIVITTCPEIVSQAVAEFTIRHILDATNRLGWNRERALFSELSVGIVGYGNVGSRVKSMCSALSIPTYTYDINPVLGCNDASDLSKVLASNVVTWHIPYKTPEINNAGVIGADVLSIVGGQYLTLLNFSRPGLFDPVALCAFCGSRRGDSMRTHVYIDGRWDVCKYGQLTRLGNYANAYPSMIHEYEHVASYATTTRKEMIHTAMADALSAWIKENN